MARGRLLYCDSENHADLLYAAGVFAPDPFLWFEVAGQATVVVSPLEIGRFRKSVHPGVRVLGMGEAKRHYHARSHQTADLVAAIAKAEKVRSWEVPADFPLGLATALRRRKLRIIPAKGHFFPARATKTAAEVEHLQRGVQLAELGLARGLEVLREAHIGAADALHWQGAPLTAERLRGEIDAAIMREGAVAKFTIVAPGAEGADPHNQGFGPIRAHQPIVIDIFPRDQRTGYFGDLTRTVVKGRAGEIVQRAFAAVRQARDEAIAKVAAGVDSQEIHRGVQQTLEAAGFATDLEAEPPTGFIHGTGHGVGLEIHEEPRISRGKCILQAGHVVTVEPGLYDPAWGGLRLEDMVVVQEGGCRNLTTVPTELELP